ncbi:hypothetical protein, partial [Streptomyces sp. NPDC003832]
LGGGGGGGGGHADAEAFAGGGEREAGEVFAVVDDSASSSVASTAFVCGPLLTVPVGSGMMSAMTQTRKADGA